MALFQARGNSSDASRLTRIERETLAAVCDAFFPAIDDVPGAISLSVPERIEETLPSIARRERDRILDLGFGGNAKWYTRAFRDLRFSLFRGRRRLLGRLTTGSRCEKRDSAFDQNFRRSPKLVPNHPLPVERWSHHCRRRTGRPQLWHLLRHAATRSTHQP